MHIRKLGKIITTFVIFIGFSIQTAAAEEKRQYQLETITVSAQKREENVQDIPLSVGVLNGMQLEEERATALYDLDKLFPNLYMASAGGSGSYTYLGIRGRINGDADVDPTVTVLVDGVPYDDFYSMGSNLLYDVERVEVLRGPQSTIYGQNSIAGVINIVTRQPDEFSRIKVYAEGAAGPKWDGSWLTGGSMNGALVKEKLFGGLAIMSKRQGGYIKNEHTGNRYNDDQTTGVKGDLLWTPSDAWRISMGLAYTGYDADYSETYLPVDEDAAAAIHTEYEEWQINTDWEGHSEVETWAPHLKISYDAETWKLTSLSAFRSATQNFDFDPYLSPTGGYLGIIKNNSQAFSQELRVQSDTTEEESNLQWLGGYSLNVFRREQKLGWALISTPSSENFFKDSTLEGVSNAFFGQATYRFLDKALGLTLGARQEWTQRKARSNKGLFEDDTVKDSQFLPKVALDYRITPKVMAYASLAQGWRAGGMNPLASNNAQAKYDKETSWTYEIGAKTKLFDNRVTLNTSAFYTQYSDYQDRVYVSPGTAYLTNAPEVRMLGVEAELRARLTPGLLLTGSVGYVNAEYEDFPDAGHGNLKGNKVMFVPNFDAHVALKYTFLDHYYVRPEVQGVGTLYWDRANTQKQNPYALLNMRLGYTGDTFEVYLFGENLTNQYKFTQATDYLSTGYYYGTPITPLRIGLGATCEF